MKNIYLIRHGESQSNADKDVMSFTPNSKVPLTEKGKQQAMEAGRTLLSMGVDVASYHVSPYLRTRQTYSIIKDSVKPYDMFEDIRLREVDTGNFITRERYHELLAEKAAYGDKLFWRWPNGESCADVFVRARDWFKTYIQLDAKYNPGGLIPTVIVSHAATIQVLRMIINNHTVEWFNSTTKIPNCEIIHERFDETSFI